MHSKIHAPFLYVFAIIVIVSLACNIPGSTPQIAPVEPVQPVPPVAPPATATFFSAESNLPTVPPPTNTPVITHVDVPASSVTMGKIIYDVESSVTAKENRAPYGDSYDIYRMERPFTQTDMIYNPDMDISTYNVTVTDKWVYVSIELIGFDPNNPVGINYGVELDTTGDGFGEFIIWSNPPYKPEWTTDGVQVFADENHDTGGLSAEISEAPLDGDGYEKKIFDSGVGDDPDLAWVRINAGGQATVQFAFKKTLGGGSYLLGVVADAGLKDVGQMYYNDRFTETEAGSPEKSEKPYPLKALYLFDNACREPVNYKINGYEPQLCPREQPEPKPRTPGTEPPPQPCQPQPCPGGYWVGEPTCSCQYLY